MTWKQLPIWFAAVLAISCGGNPGSPTAPTVDNSSSYVGGVWHGPLTINRRYDLEDLAPLTSDSTWTFTGTGSVNTLFRVTIQTTNGFLPASITADGAISPPAAPGAQIAANGSYPSSRGCVALYGFVGNIVSTSHIEADVSGIDCKLAPTDPSQITFQGRVSLSR